MNCSKSIHEIHFFLRGLHTGTDVIDTFPWLDWLFDGSESVMDSEEQVQRLIKNLMGLWQQIAAAHEEDTPLPEIAEDFPNTIEGVTARATTIKQKNLAFVHGLEVADTGLLEMTPDGRVAFNDLARSETLCKECLEVAREYKFSQKEQFAEFHKNLDYIEEVIEQDIKRIVISLAEARQAASLRREVVFELTGDEKKNAPCPCGSGKKYKKCCWLKVH